MYLVLELWSATPRWAALSEEERVAFVDRVGQEVGALADAGVVPLHWGANSLPIQPVAPQQFWGVWTAADADAAHRLGEAIAASGWCDYFDQITAPGPVETPQAVLARLISGSEA